MNPADPRPLLDRHAARILARWREQLRALPPSSALAAPELLTPLMAPALTRLRHEVSSADAAAQTEATRPPECRCGLNPLLAFYLTGEFAVFEVLWSQPDALAPLDPKERESLCGRLRSAWRRVAHAEVETFCSLCQNGKDAGSVKADCNTLNASTQAYALQAKAKSGKVGARRRVNASGRGASAPARGKSSATARQSAGTRG